MATTPTVSELRKAAEITNDEIDAAIDAYFAGPKAAPFQFACGHAIDVAAAVHAYPPAAAVVTDADRTAKFKWTLVRTSYQPDIPRRPELPIVNGRTEG